MMGAVSSCSSEQSDSSADGPIKVDIHAFLEEFGVNETAALEKYKGKTIQTSGYVGYKLDEKDNALFRKSGAISGAAVPIYQKVGSISKTVICDMEESKASALATNQSVTISGTVDSSAIGMVIVRNCSVVE